MEDKQAMNIYFIYSQKGRENNIETFELNDKIKKVQEISKEIQEDNIQVLYCIEFCKNEGEEEFDISLSDIEGLKYISKFSLNNIDENFNKELFIFNLKFTPIENIYGNKLDQYILSYEDQFYIFERNLEKADNRLINLYFTAINEILLKTKQEFSFILDLFLKIFDKKKNEKLPQLKDVLKQFFKNMKQILKNSEIWQELKIPEQQLIIFNDIDNIRTQLINITQEPEENIDIFLTYYYIHYKKKLFIKFISNPNYNESIYNHLNLNREFFNDFTTEIITPDLFNEAESGIELIYLMKLYPNIVECFKILTNYEIFLKFINFKFLEKKAINIMMIQNPKKNDNIDLLQEYFKKVYEFFLVEGVYPLIIKENFFVEYFKLFEGEEEDFHKDMKIIEMFELYNSKIDRKLNSEVIQELHLKRGISLIKNKKLKNIDFIEFIKKFPNLLKDNEYLFDYFQYGIEFEGTDGKFVNDILNEDKYKLKKYLGVEKYKILFERIFDKFVLPKDLLPLRYWNVAFETPDIMVELLMKTIKRIWLNNPENSMFGLDNLLAREFVYAAWRMEDFLLILNDIEAKIEKEKLMRIYSLVLLKNLTMKKDFKNHIIDYIANYDKFSTIYIWYLASTKPDEVSRIAFLGNYLENGGENYVVKYSDFSTYPDKVEERILLFTELKYSKYIPAHFQEYYKNSIKAKNDIEKNIFKDALLMHSNITKIQQLLTSVFLDNQDEEMNLYLIIINFEEKIEKAKKYYDSLKNIQSFWSSFFPNEKKDELIKLNQTINEFENKTLENCANEAELDIAFKNILQDAEKGSQLKDSIIFMEIYNRLSYLKDKEAERYDLSIKKFDELKKLENDFNSIDDEVKENIYKALSENNNSLNDELILIKKYFKLGENNNNFDLEKIKNNILDLIKNQQMKSGVYEFKLDEKFSESKK